MPEFWQFSTVSMGLGPVNAIYQARFLKIFRKPWPKRYFGSKSICILSDGEMMKSNLKVHYHSPVCEKLNNLIFTISCNLQRLDGPVNGNGKIVQELEALFTGCGWEVIKVLW
ncbi:Pyruvate dehydrogenase E1 component [Mannheimia haemolytica]|uniref:Pyruvate dehydrogenase E1 component n=1 Tax=Mannheimia haemolytica TaxID=75985 RepID=A0A378N8D9_MANHA|nr:Pyruvate dehydrogenase E1 component [Mannheimia haemolytica]